MSEDDGYRTHSCPICGLRISEDADENGETITTNYADHYDAEHPDEPETSGAALYA